MTLTPSSELEAQNAADLSSEEAGFDPALLEDVPSADDSSSRVASRTPVHFGLSRQSAAMAPSRCR